MLLPITPLNLEKKTPCTKFQDGWGLLLQSGDEKNRVTDSRGKLGKDLGKGGRENWGGCEEGPGKAWLRNRGEVPRGGTFGE